MFTNLAGTQERSSKADRKCYTAFDRPLYHMSRFLPHAGWIIYKWPSRGKDANGNFKFKHFILVFSSSISSRNICSLIFFIFARWANFEGVSDIQHYFKTWDLESVGGERHGSLLIDKLVLYIFTSLASYFVKQSPWVQLISTFLCFVLLRSLVEYWAWLMDAFPKKNKLLSILVKIHTQSALT